MGRASARARRPKRERDSGADRFVGRPFEGLSSETEWVAMREVVPAATATVRLTEAAGPEHAGGEVTLATVLPLTWPGMVTPDGRRMVALQSPARSGDLSRDLAQALELTLTGPPNHRVVLAGLPGLGPRLQDLIAPGPLTVEVRPDFSFWENTVEPADEEITAGMRRANGVMEPTTRIDGTTSAYWCRTGPGEAGAADAATAQVRWVLPYGEDAALLALARVYATDQLSLGEGTKFVGTYRAHGLLVPVWDLPGAPTADDWADPVAKLSTRLAEAATSDVPLTDPERRAREHLRQRLMTLR